MNTVTPGFRFFLAAVNAYRASLCLRTDNSLETTNDELYGLMDDVKRLPRVHVRPRSEAQRASGAKARSLVTDTAVAAFLNFHTVFDRVEFSTKALDYSSTGPEASTWICEALSLMARVDEKPGMMCAFEKFHERPCNRDATRSSGRPKRGPGANPVSILTPVTPCFGLPHDLAVTIMHRERLDRRDVGVPAGAVQGEMGHG